MHFKCRRKLSIAAQSRRECSRNVLCHFEFLRSYLIVQVNKRVTVSVSILFHYFIVFISDASAETATIVYMFSYYL